LPLPVVDGLACLSLALAHPAAQQVVVAADWSQLIERTYSNQTPSLLRALEGLHEDDAPAAKLTANNELRRQLDEQPISRRDLLQSYIVVLLRELLGANPETALDISRGFFELGLDSLRAVQLRTALAAALRCPIASSALFDHPNVAALSNHLLELVYPEPPAAEPPSPKLADPCDDRGLSQLSLAELATSLEQLLD
jgi:acyl carrier protein